MIFNYLVKCTCKCMKRLPPMWASPVSLYCLRLPLTPSSPISITFESCWAGQSWQRCCPVRAQRLRISHHPAAGLSTLCHPPKMHCLKVVVVQNPFFSASSRVYFLHLALSVLESNLRWESANLRMLARHVRSSLCRRISHRGLPTICPAPSQSSIHPATLDREPHS